MLRESILHDILNLNLDLTSVLICWSASIQPWHISNWSSRSFSLQIALEDNGHIVEKPACFYTCHGGKILVILVPSTFLHCAMSLDFADSAILFPAPLLLIDKLVNGLSPSKHELPCKSKLSTLTKFCKYFFDVLAVLRGTIRELLTASLVISVECVNSARTLKWSWLEQIWQSCSNNLRRAEWWEDGCIATRYRFDYQDISPRGKGEQGMIVLPTLWSSSIFLRGMAKKFVSSLFDSNLSLLSRWVLLL